MTMQTVSFYSYKGGVGRTLLVANTAQFLAMSGRRVVALDLDLEAPGLVHKLLDSDTINRAAVGELRGAVDELLDIMLGPPTNSNLRDSGVGVPLPIQSKGSLILIPAGSAPSHSYWAALDQLNSTIRSNGRNGRLLEAVLELQARIEKVFAPDYLLIDSRTGITELSGLATSVLADRVVCLTTTAPESIDGTRVVADALRAAPRLTSQDPVRIDLLVTRAMPGFPTSAADEKLQSLFGGSISVLPHDSVIANKERVLANPRSDRSGADSQDSALDLFTATLSWIADAFPTHNQEAASAKRRLLAIHRAWQELTNTSERIGTGTRGRSAWPIEQLKERVTFHKGTEARLADIVAYSAKPGPLVGGPLMIIEYIDGNDTDAAARWWIDGGFARIVAIIGNPSAGTSRIAVYSGRADDSRDLRASERPDFPLPQDFEAFSDPANVSIASLLAAVKEGYTDYLDRIVGAWVNSVFVGVHGGSPWQPQVALQIVDELARIENVELAMEVLTAATPDWSSHNRTKFMFDGGEVDQIWTDLFARLVWRFPPEITCRVLNEINPIAHDSRARRVLKEVARNILGLQYDPDAAFRRDASRILGLDDPGDTIHGLSLLFRHTEISYDITSDTPPILSSGFNSANKKPPKQISSLMKTLIESRSLIITGLLGDYQFRHGRVVLHREAISHCASLLALRERYVGSVTLIHQSLHALSHLGRDLDGAMWSEYALPVANSPLFEPSWFHEALTQYFTYRHILWLQDRELLHAFEIMSEKMTPPYRTWRRLRGMRIEDARQWLVSLRRGVGDSANISYMFYNAMTDDT